MKTSVDLKLSIWTFCLIFIIPTDSTKQPSLELSNDRHFNPVYTASENHSHQEENYSPPREVRHDPNIWESVLKKHRSYNSREFYSRPNKNENYLTEEKPKVIRTYGRGKAQVTRQGQTVNVPNEYGRNGYRVAMSANENEIKPPRYRGVCRECPSDQTVIVSKGKVFVILPEPCQLNAKMWNHHSGPRPGSKIGEGMHTIRGYIGPKKKFCQYNYQVLGKLQNIKSLNNSLTEVCFQPIELRRCDPLKFSESTVIQCSAENSWGSICNVSCSDDKEPLGPTEIECKEDLTWSNPVPLCKSKMDCSPPKVKSKISCQTADKRQAEGEFFPNGSTCTFRQNEKELSLNCKDGRWRIIRKSKNSMKNKKLNKSTPEKKTDPCSPNPCQNGGTCLRSESNKEPPICKCRPQTRGEHCQMRECYYNICENDGLCFFQNDERVCYCTPEYSGETCQNYRPQ